MDWHRPSDKPVSEPMMISLLTQIYAPRGLSELNGHPMGGVTPRYILLRLEMVTDYYELMFAEAMVPTRTRILTESLLTFWIAFICELLQKQYMFDYTTIWDEKWI